MAYVNATVVYSRDSGRTFTSTSKPSTQMVGDFIDQTSAELDGILRKRGYALPIATSATSALKMLEGFNAMGAIAMVELTAPSPAGKRDDTMRAWENAKRMLAMGDIELEAAMDVSNALPRGAGFPASPMFPLTGES